MRSWFRGKRGGLFAFVAIAALLAGGLAWATSAALRLEREQVEARAEAEFQGKLRQALWQLDSIMMAKLSQEASRPFHHFSALYAPTNPVDRVGNRSDPGELLEISPLVSAELPNWILLHFSTSPDIPTWQEKNWWSPQVLPVDMQRRLEGITQIPADPLEEKASLLSEMCQLSPEALLGAVRREEQRQVAIRVQLFDEDTNAPPGKQGGQANYSANQTVLQQQPGLNEFTSRAGRFAYGQEQAKNPGPGNTAIVGRLSPNGEHWLRVGLREKSREELVTLGPWNVLWIKPEPNRERLIVARRASVAKQQLCQGILLNWETLKKDLLSEVRDIFPEADLKPIRHENAAALELKPGLPPHPERTMASLPVELDPGPLPALADLGWTPLRIGVTLAWVAALVALAAIGLGGWSLIDLSQRRVRFVSTVTHELRTPLTTLRLYLDMLTGGMVRSDKQKEEYLHTLNAETDRLNRLVGNVLDFSRLENQRPGLEKGPVPIADLLDEVRGNWQTRCKDADKELIVENQLEPAATLITDRKLVEQVLGNLIDNACKYSRSAEDRRVWLRARAEKNHIIFEVEDRGPGVAKRERRSIFRPFQRGTHADVITGGVGLGLALSQRWAGLLGGTLTVQPVPGATGACFRLELPTS
jgi:signal transduction histidine kinase